MSTSPQSGSPRLARLAKLTELIVKSCVRQEDAVAVLVEKNKLIIEVSPKDRGRLIGKGGRNLRALEDLLSLAELSATNRNEAQPSPRLPLIDVVARRDETTSTSR